jgi:hypothetical protein
MSTPETAILKQNRLAGLATYPPDDGRTSSAVAGTELGPRRPALSGPQLLRVLRSSLRAFLPRYSPPIAAFAANPWSGFPAFRFAKFASTPYIP